MFSSKNGVASLMPCSTLSAMWNEKPMQRSRAQLALSPGAGARLAEGVHDLLVGPARRRAAADDALDVVLGHEVERARARADHRLPALDGQRLRPRHQRDLLKLVAPVGHRGRDRVVLALVREGALVERLEDELDLLLEQLAVGVLVEHAAPRTPRPRACGSRARRRRRPGRRSASRRWRSPRPSGADATSARC